ncbi:UNVERIFIED_CONTAM: hypothetical protein DES50_12216 [Williamsia faeni]
MAAKSLKVLANSLEEPVMTMASELPSLVPRSTDWTALGRHRPSRATATGTRSQITPRPSPMPSTTPWTDQTTRPKGSG